jgi:hypothetical protein
MKILSVNVGLPREVLSGKDIVTTGIFKEPVEGPVKLRKLNLDGDKQADLTVEKTRLYTHILTSTTITGSLNCLIQISLGECLAKILPRKG